MGKRYLMALDAGGGSGRCLLLDVDTGAIIATKRGWAHPAAPDTAGLGYDMDLPRIWSKLCEASREALRAAQADPGDILGISATSMRNTTVILDDNGRTIFSAPNQDARALAEALGLGAERGEDLQSTGGHWPSPLFTGARLLWMKNNAPDLLERAGKVLSLSDWLGYRCCGEALSERSQAGETLLYDLDLDGWSPHIIEALGLPEAIFPPLVDAGTRIGSLAGQPASDLGLVPGIPVAAGGADTQCALLGAGACEPADLVVVAGTTLPIQLVCSKLVLDPDGRLWSGRHAVTGLFVLESNGLTAGYALEWFAKLLFAGCDHPIQVLLGEAAGSDPGAHGVYSTLGACLFDARTLGIPLGSLTMSHMVTPDYDKGRSHISRALIEGIAYSARANSEQISAVAGTEADRVIVTGGMSRSSLWTRILADVLGREVIVSSTPDSSSLGAAICAGVGAGVYPDLVQGSRAVSGAGGRQEPGDSSEKYQSLFGGWSEYLKLRGPSDAHLSGLMTMSMLEHSSRGGAAPEPLFRPTILVTASLDDVALNELAELGEVEYAPWRERQVVYDGGPALVEALQGYRILITEMDIVDFETIRSLPELKAIVSCRVNPVNVDLECATAHAIPVINTPGRNADAVADLVLACMLMLGRKLQEAPGFLKLPGKAAGESARMGEAYFKYQGSELWRKTVGIVGLGEVGRRVAVRARSCGARIVFQDPDVSAETGAKFNAEKMTLEELLAASDFVTLHAPASPATEGMMGPAEFAAMKEGAFFINTARASLVDAGALNDALESGRLAGAALDVFPVEPPASDDPVVTRDNVIATPHLGGNTYEVAAHQGAIAVGQLRKLLRGDRPDHILNPEVLEAFDWTGPRPEPPASELERLSLRPRPTMTS